MILPIDLTQTVIQKGLNRQLWSFHIHSTFSASAGLMPDALYA
jgi:hypothetical protein